MAVTAHPRKNTGLIEVGIMVHIGDAEQGVRIDKIWHHLGRERANGVGLGIQLGLMYGRRTT